MPTPELETAEEFWVRLDAEIEQNEGGGVYLGGHAVALIEADRAAVALAILNDWRQMRVWMSESEAFEQLVAKYAKPDGRNGET